MLTSTIKKNLQDIRLTHIKATSINKKSMLLNRGNKGLMQEGLGAKTLGLNSISAKTTRRQNIGAKMSAPKCRRQNGAVPCLLPVFH